MKDPNSELARLKWDISHTYPWVLPRCRLYYDQHYYSGLEADCASPDLSFTTSYGHKHKESITYTPTRNLHCCLPINQIKTAF